MIEGLNQLNDNRKERKELKPQPEVESEPASSFQITGPGFYRARCGAKAEVKSGWREGLFKWMGNVDGYPKTWTDNGRINLQHKTLDDIVAVWVDFDPNEEQRQRTVKQEPGRPRPEFCQHPRPPRYVVNSDTAVPCVRDTRRNKDIELADVVEMLNDYEYGDMEGEGK